MLVFVDNEGGEGAVDMTTKAIVVVAVAVSQPKLLAANNQISDCFLKIIIVIFFFQF
jgi:hypothetical protein